ncbi:MAG: glycosyltransferase family 2 protein [Candidatus Daviesbacteria bacterium]|nr:glycosyltransferase family 2 protein [Candidatus Daviesbacteria bacterium]
MKDLTVIILNYNTKDLLHTCLESIFKNKWKTDLEVWVVDNASTDDSVEMVKKDFPKVTVLQSNKNLGFAGGNNLALKKITSRYALLLNSDTTVEQEAFDKLVNFADGDGYDIASCKLLNKDRSIQPNYGDLPYPTAVFFWISGLDDLPVIGKFLPSFHKKIINPGKVGWISGTAMLISKKVLEKIGLLDEDIFMYAEDTDFCMRAKKAGFKIGWTNLAEITHLGGGSLKDPNYRQWTGEFKGLIYLYQKYYGGLQSIILRLIFYKFILLRILIFSVLGKFEISKIYAKVFFTI